jgi:hypothetical protein
VVAHSILLRAAADGFVPRSLFWLCRRIGSRSLTKEAEQSNRNNERGHREEKDHIGVEEISRNVQLRTALTGDSSMRGATVMVLL